VDAIWRAASLGAPAPQSMEKSPAVLPPGRWEAKQKTSDSCPSRLWRTSSRRGSAPSLGLLDGCTGRTSRYLPEILRVQYELVARDMLRTV
jgi:hypothetical protein